MATWLTSPLSPKSSDNWDINQGLVWCEGEKWKSTAQPIETNKQPTNPQA